MCVCVRACVCIRVSPRGVFSGWVNTLVGGQKGGAKGFMFFTVTVDLSEEGIGTFRRHVATFTSTSWGTVPRPLTCEMCRDVVRLILTLGRRDVTLKCEISG